MGVVIFSLSFFTIFLFTVGVGRTGTLVGLDSMLQQLNEEGCASIFNTICDLRHQRNYLVQSLVSKDSKIWLQFNGRFYTISNAMCYNL